MLPSLLNMTDAEYVFLLIKLLGVLVAILGGLVTILAFAYKGGIFVWSRILERLRTDLSSTFLTMDKLDHIAQLLLKLEATVNDGFQNINARLQSGDERMNCFDHRVNNLDKALHGKDDP